MSISFSQLWQGFLLGNAAILTNVCILPLYPGLIAYLAGNVSQKDAKRLEEGKLLDILLLLPLRMWLGVLVLLGILTLMTAVGGLLYLLQQSAGSLLIWLLPIIYGIIILLGILMLMGNNPFSRLTTTQIPLLDNPYIGAYLYGLLLGPMTLPCAGPIIVTAFLVGAGNITSLSNSLLFFFAFGIGFGWPLVLLPVLATSLQAVFTKWMTKNYKLLTRISGALLIAIGLFGLITEWLPAYRLTN